MPEGNEKLSSLQVLNGFGIGTARKNQCRITDLRDSTKLRRLSVHIGRGGATTGAESAPLKDVASLCSLTISWGVTASARGLVDWDLPEELEKPELIVMPAERMPDLKSVKKLYIIGGRVASLDPPGQIHRSSVEMLQLKHLRRLRIGNTGDMLKKFPRLVYFESRDCAGDDMPWHRSRQIKKGIEQLLKRPRERELEFEQKLFL